MSGAGVGGCTACGGGPGWEAETWLIESPTPLASWARATPETKRRRQRETVSLVFMTSPQGKITVTSLLFYDRLDCRLPPSRREEHPQEGRPTKSALGTAPAAAWARAHGGRQEAGDQEAQSLGVESKRGGGKISAKHTLAGTRSRVGPANAWRFTMKAQAKYVKRTYKIANWPEYEAGLRQRGSLTVWISEAELKGWAPPRNGRMNPVHRSDAQPSAERVDSDAAMAAAGRGAQVGGWNLAVGPEPRRLAVEVT